jgi:hypothetical protein
MVSRRRRSLGAWTLASLVSVVAGACLIAPPPLKGPCAADAECDDANLCTIDVCAEDGFCDQEPSELAPDDNDECTKDACNGSNEVHDPVEDGTACGFKGGLTCVAGKCKCTVATECGVNTKCITFTCDNGECKSDNAAPNTPVDDALQDDCKKYVCDGAGNVIEAPDLMDFPADTVAGDCRKNGCDALGVLNDVENTADVPQDDGNPCTLEGCNGADPILHQPVADMTPCQPGPSCDSIGGVAQAIGQSICIAGACSTPAPKSCGYFECNDAKDACRTDCAADINCAVGAICNVGAMKCEAKGNTGQVCNGDAQCATSHCVDGVCCGTACTATCQRCDLPGFLGLCNNIPSGQDPDNECSGTGVCNGAAACAQPQGSTCGADLECVGAQCEDGRCCNLDCPGPCRRCDQGGSSGTCVNVGVGQMPSGCNGAGQACDAGGNCAKSNGTTCGSNAECATGNCVDGVCCESTCLGLCKACSNSKTGQGDGLCKFVPDKQDPDNECSGPCNMGDGDNCCNGDGTCQ